MKRRTSKVTTGSLINKLERAIAVANMRGDRATAELLCKKLADAIDYGHENNVPAKLVDPVRRAQKAVSDALLPAPSAA